MKFNRNLLLGATAMVAFSTPVMAGLTEVNVVGTDNEFINKIIANQIVETGGYNPADASTYYNSIYSMYYVNRDSSLILNGGKYSGNTADVGVFSVASERLNENKKSGTLIIKNNAKFENNISLFDGGAIASYGNLVIDSAEFVGNMAAQHQYAAQDTSAIGGGAIALGSVSSTEIGTISNTVFKNNQSGTYGGAIGTRHGKDGDNSGARLDIEALFEGNSAELAGGAIYNTFYADNGLDKGNGVTIKGTFTSNMAGVEGGAIYNDGSKDSKGNVGGVMTITSSSFTGNRAVVDGGAIFNTGDLTVESSIFDKNAASINSNDDYGYGGAIFSIARGVKIYGTDFTNNTAVAGGAIYESKSSVYDSNNANGMIISNSNFTNNHAAADGGAIGISNKAKLDNVVFTGNTAGLTKGNVTAASDSNGGGAIMVAEYGKATLSNVKFYSNESGAHGGAIAARHGAGKGLISLSSAIFDGNSAKNEGGAIASIYDGVINIDGSTFTNNTAGKNGGAIYIGKADNYGGFDGNSTLSTNGGVLNFSGENIFSGNKVGNTLNDIYNSGTINVNENSLLALDGGISGSGSIVFDATSTLQVNTMTTKISNNVTTNGAKLSMVFANAYVGDYKLITGSVTDKDFTIEENSLYNIDGKDGELGTYVISKKTSEEISQNTGANNEQAEILGAVLSGTSENDKFNDVANKVVALLQNEDTKSQGLKALSAMSVEDAPVVGASQANHTNQLFSVVSTRMTGGAVNANAGKSSGDPLENSATWVQGMINHTKLDGQFDTDTRGLAFGFEKNLNDEIKVGIGYALAKTDINSYSRDTQIKTHSAIAYGEYKPSNWFVNGILSYSVSDYEEDKVVAGVNGEADYKANNISAQLVTGYEYLAKYTMVTPIIGLRYMNVDRDGYTDALGTHVSSNNLDTLTALIGVKLTNSYVINEKTYTPELRMAVTYDIIRNSDDSLIALANGASYSVNNSYMKRFAYEFGVGVTTAINDEWELNVAYEGKFRKDYQDHTGLINAKYHF